MSGSLDSYLILSGLLFAYPVWRLGNWLQLPLAINLLITTPLFLSQFIARIALRKRSGHLLSKMRYVSAQLLAYIDDGFWLELAAAANAQAARFARAVEAHPEAQLEYPVDGNEVFVRWSPRGFEQLQEAGIEFLTWPGRDDLARFVFSYCTLPEETDALCAALNGRSQ